MSRKLLVVGILLLVIGCLSFFALTSSTVDTDRTVKHLVYSPNGTVIGYWMQWDLNALGVVSVVGMLLGLGAGIALAFVGIGEIRRR